MIKFKMNFLFFVGRKEDEVWGFLVSEMEKTTPSTAPAENAERELTGYFSERRLEIGQDPFDWWFKEGQKYKRLVRLAMKYLVIPGTSVPSERVFSDAGNVLTKKRSCLKDENVQMLVCLKSMLK